MSTVAWPERRQDIIDALAILATLRLQDTSCWPGLTEAVHWLIDDTFWDHRHPGDDIGTILIDHGEAEAIAETLAPLIAILNELGPTAVNDDYLTHPRWHEVARAATAAHQLMTGRQPASPRTDGAAEEQPSSQHGR